MIVEMHKKSRKWLFLYACKWYKKSKFEGVNVVVGVVKLINRKNKAYNNYDSSIFSITEADFENRTINWRDNGI